MEALILLRGIYNTLTDVFLFHFLKPVSINTLLELGRLETLILKDLVNIGRYVYFYVRITQNFSIGWATSSKHLEKWKNSVFKRKNFF